MKPSKINVYFVKNQFSEIVQIFFDLTAAYAYIAEDDLRKYYTVTASTIDVHFDTLDGSQLVKIEQIIKERKNK